MSVVIVAFFNNKGGVGKTSLVYHLACMYSDLGIRTLAVDLDPQANLTAAFFNEEVLETFWPDGERDRTVFGAIQPLVKRKGDVHDPHVEEIDDKLGVLVGDMLLSGFEDELSLEWPRAADGAFGSFRVLSAFWRLIRMAADREKADLALIDLGPNLGAINRAALISSDYIVVPLAPDLFSLQGLKNLGPTLNQWRRQWQNRLKISPEETRPLPTGQMQPIGYVVMQHSERLDRPVKAYKRWMDRIPRIYRREIEGEELNSEVTVSNDPYCISLLKHYRSLIPLAQEARKPIFDLKPADGALGAHTYVVRDAYAAFEKLGKDIAERVSLKIPTPLYHETATPLPD
jgi:chromosome partitioning protein